LHYYFHAATRDIMRARGLDHAKMQAAIDGVNDLDAVKSGAGSAKANAKKPTTTTFQDHFSGQTFGSSTVSFIFIPSYD
jgi:hypothetical protein